MTTLKPFIDAFAKLICGGRPALVPHRPDNLAKHTCCIENILEKVERDDGRGAFGWTFLHRISPEHGNYMIATHHAIWITPDRKPIDITPFHPDERHHPISEDDSIIFLLDDKAIPIRIARGGWAPRPLQFFPIDENAGLIAYLNDLAEEERHACQRIYDAVS